MLSVDEARWCSRVTMTRIQALFSLAKWRLLLAVLPLTGLFGLAKVATHRLGWEPWTFDLLTGSLFGVATFVTAFLLSGTLGDYTVSVAMPIKIVSAVETIQDTNELVAIAHADYDPTPLKVALGKLLDALVAWLERTQSVAAVEQALEELNPHFAAWLTLDLPPIVSRVQGEQANIRLCVHQMMNIRDTDFLGPAYTLLQLFLAGAIATLLLIHSDRFSENFVISCLLFTSFTYLLLLIRDLDNPFDYRGKSIVDVDLGLLRQTRDCFQQPSPSPLTSSLPSKVA